MNWFEIYAIVGVPTLMMICAYGVFWMAKHYP